jgi:hypothetical protein
MSTKPKKRTFLSKELAKKIAIWKSNHPEATLADLAKKFSVKEHQARYALQKHAEGSELLRGTKKGQHLAAQMMQSENDDLDVMKTQLQLCAGILETDQRLKITKRVDLLYKMSRIRQFLQSVDLEAHIKRADAEIIVRIIRRFMPEASNDDAIKIYNEELAKWKVEKK